MPSSTRPSSHRRSRKRSRLREWRSKAGRRNSLPSTCARKQRNGERSSRLRASSHSSPATERRTMKLRRFGRTGIQVSEVVFGAGAVGGILVHKDDATKREAIRRAMAGGINWVDTAAQYGNGKSEESLGWLLPEAGFKPHLSTKFNLDVENLKDIPAQIEERFRGSLARLKRSSVDVLQLHNRIGSKPGGRVMTVEQILGKNGVAEGMERLREKGLIRHMGITAIGEAASVCEVIRSGRFQSAQVYYNLLNPSAARKMPKAWVGHDFSGVIETCKAR